MPLPTTFAVVNSPLRASCAPFVAIFAVQLNALPTPFAANLIPPIAFLIPDQTNFPTQTNDFPIPFAALPIKVNSLFALEPSTFGLINSPLPKDKILFAFSNPNSVVVKALTAKLIPKIEPASILNSVGCFEAKEPSTSNNGNAILSVNPNVPNPADPKSLIILKKSVISLA
ncbi:hypothetical protein R077811_01537 [Convivina intestini]|nr:hypothetical protein R077811_01537 [Convivina intestini]